MGKARGLDRQQRDLEVLEGLQMKFLRGICHCTQHLDRMQAGMQPQGRACGGEENSQDYANTC